MAKQVDRKKGESVLRNGTPADMYALIPRHARKRFAAFAKCFGISKSDIARLRETT